MVRNRSWPAVSHYHLRQLKQLDQVAEGRAHNLKLHCLAVKFNRSDFLPTVSGIFVRLGRGTWNYTRSQHRS